MRMQLKAYDSVSRQLRDRMILCVLVGLTLMPAPLSALDDRKVVTRVAPAYPELARRMHASGTVQVSATVAPDGHVDKAKATAGHPLLCTAAEDAVKRWKFTPGTDTTTVVVAVIFADSQ